MSAPAPEVIAHQGTLFGPPDRWVKRWRVESRTTPDKRYTVAVDAGGSWGCSCPGWIYHRSRCAHIDQVAGLADALGGVSGGKPLGEHADSGRAEAGHRLREAR